MEERIQSLLKEVQEFAGQGKQAVESFRRKFVSKKGLIGELFEELKKVPVEQKKAVGKVLNELKQAAESKLASLSAGSEDASSATPPIDLTLPVAADIGNLHPLSLTRYRIIEIFERLGFNVADGP